MHFILARSILGANYGILHTHQGAVVHESAFTDAGSNLKEFGGRRASQAVAKFGTTQTARLRQLCAALVCVSVSSLYRAHSTNGVRI